MFVKLCIVCPGRIGYDYFEYPYDLLIYYSLSNACFRFDDERLLSASNTNRLVFKLRKAFNLFKYFWQLHYYVSICFFGKPWKLSNRLMFIISNACHTLLDIQNKIYETSKHLLTHWNFIIKCRVRSSQHSMLFDALHCTLGT